MNTALKSICFFVLSVLIGNWLSHHFAYQTPVHINMESWLEGINALPARIIFSSVLSLPILIPIVLVFGLIKTYRPYFPLNILVSTIFGLTVSLLWSAILALLFHWFRDITAWLAFVAGVAGAAAITESLSTLAHKININFMAIFHPK